MNESLIRAAVKAHQAGDLDQAARLYGAVLRSEPRNFQALYFLGFLHSQTGQYDRAERLMAEAIAVNPRSPDAAYNRACALQKLQRHGEAVAAFDAALVLKPDYLDALVNRGVALLAMKRAGDALASFDRALALDPKDVEALANRASALFALKRYTESADTYERVLAVAPDHPYSRGTLALARAFACDWRQEKENLGRVAADIRAGKRAMPPHAATLILDDPALQLDAARIWTADRHPPAGEPLCAAPRGRRDKIRLAYLSADYAAHATAYLTAGLFERQDRARFEIAGVSFGPDDGSAMRARLVKAFDRFIDVREMSDADAAKLLREAEIDIAVDLKGFTDGARPGILAHRPAPVQVNYLGHPGTMGAPYIDYIVADRTIISEADVRHYSECAVWLPGCYQANDDRRAIAERTPSRAECGLPPRGFVFCSFNNLYKIRPAVFDVWMRLLSRAEGSVLWLFADNGEAMGNLKREAEARGIAAGRLVFAPRVPQEEHLARHRLADLFLDTAPCNAHTTASDALWAGLPLITMAGTTFAGRVGASVAGAAGLPELVTQSLEEYESLALALTRDTKRLAMLRTKLDEGRRTSALFDTVRFTRHLESGLLQMHERAVRGLKPAAFAVAP